MKKYECVFILDESKVDGSAEAFMATVSDYIKSIGGDVVESVDMGRRTFAYPINKKNSGLYWDLTVNLAPTSVVEFKENFRLTNAIVRMEVLTFDRPAEPVTLSSRR